MKQHFQHHNKKRFQRSDLFRPNLRNPLISTHPEPYLYFTLDIRHTHSTCLETLS